MQTIKPISRQLADYLASIGLHLSPKPNSVFAPLVESLAIEAERDYSADISTEEFALKVNNRFDDIRPNIFSRGFEAEDVATEPEPGVVYDEVCFQAVKEFRPIVLGLIDSLKTIVNPAVNTIFENAYNCVSDQVETGGVKLDVITNNDELAIWSNAAWYQLVSSSIDDITANQEVCGELTFPDMEVSELLLRLKTGNELIDAEVADYLERFNSATLVEHTYSEIFHNEGATRYTGQGQVPESVVAYLLARSFMANIPEGVYGLEEAPYMMELSRVACWHAREIMRFAEAKTRGETTDELIVSFPDEGQTFVNGSTIVVCGTAYAKFLELGGSIDAIYGSYVGPRLRKMHEILEIAPRLEQQWLTHVRIAQSANLDDFQRKFVYELRRNIINYGKDNGLDIDHDIIDEMFEDEFILKPENAFMVTRPIIIDALWKGSEYNNILRSVDTICDNMSGIEFEEALELGIIEWLVQWALTHVNVTYVKP